MITMIISVSVLFVIAINLPESDAEHLIDHPDLTEKYLVRQKRDTTINVTVLEQLKSTNECGKETRASACRLLEAHNIGYVWLWPVSLGIPYTKTGTPLQAATTESSALNNVIDLCSGKKASAPYGGLKFCVCSTALDTIYNYAADQLFFSLPVYSLTVLDGSQCTEDMMEDRHSKNSGGKTGPILPLGMTTPRTTTTTTSPLDLSLMDLPGFHTFDFSCGFANNGVFSGAVSICSQVAQFCASAISKHQFVTAAMRNYSQTDLPTVGIIEMLPFTEYKCGRKFPHQFSIRCTIPCTYTL